MAGIVYPSPEKVIEYNFLALELIKAKKADKPKVLSYSKIGNILEDCRDKEGDIYGKAVVLLKGIIQKHPFASGNRRTALITTKEFILMNHAIFGIIDEPQYAKSLQGIREGYYADEEIKEWIQNGKIRQFKR